MRKRNIKTWKQIAWKFCSEYNRRKMATYDGYTRCVTCGTVAHWSELQAGHIIDGRGNAILFCDDAIFPQCYACNCCKHGNKVNYVRWFIDKFGLRKLDELCALAKKPLKRRVEDYEVLIEEYKSKIAKLEGAKIETTQNQGKQSIKGIYEKVLY
jgi:hypothetical protein